MVIVVVRDAKRITKEMKEDLVALSTTPKPPYQGADDIHLSAIGSTPYPLSSHSSTPNPLSGAVKTSYTGYGPDETLPDLPFIPYRGDLKDLARELRNKPTNAEKIIWNEILSNKKTGYKFTQQKPLDGYIVDFYCPALLTAIEIDGSSHDDKQKKDAARTEDLNSMVIKVIRYTNDQIENDLAFVGNDLQNKLQEREKEIHKLKTSPLIRGYGGCATSLLIGEQSKPADLSYAQSFEVLIGKPSITEIVNDVTYEIHPNSFFQTNTKMAARLQDVVLDVVKKAGTKKLLDLYCGLGFFGIAAAKKIGEIEEVVGYELDEEAIKLASQNMNLNEVGEKCRFFSGPAEALDWKDVNADTIILDPPRSGLHHKVIQTLLAEDSPTYPQTIIYVSCNYHKLEHELPSFMEKYEVISIQPLDLFPQTRHIETVVTLKLKA
jgi:very-short-patch-repair endonuclease/16S rRNA G966 N2-methylase RsmD